MKVFVYYNPQPGVTHMCLSDLMHLIEREDARAEAALFDVLTEENQ